MPFALTLAFSMALAAPTVADPPDRGARAAETPAALPVSTRSTTLEIRLVQVDLERLAAIEREEDAALDLWQFSGITVGLSIGGESGGVRFKPPVFHLGDDGTLRLGNRVWQLGAALDDARRGMAQPGSPFTVLMAPRLTCLEGETASMAMGSPVEYMLRDADGCLRLADDRDEAFTEGVTIELRPALISDEAVEVDPLDVTLRRVVAREPIEGLALDIGRPVIEERRLRREVRILPGDVAVIPLSLPKDGDPIFVVLSRD